MQSSGRSRFVATVILTIIGVWGGTYLATSRWKSNEAITGGAPQQTVAALWAVMDLLIVLAWIGAALVIAVAWVGRMLTSSQPTALQGVSGVPTREVDGWHVGPTMSGPPEESPDP